MHHDKSKKKKVTAKHGTKITVQVKQPRKLVEPAEWYYAKLTGAEVKESTKFPGSQFMQMDFELTKHSDNMLQDGKTSAKGLKFNGIWGMPVAPGKKIYKVLCAIAGKTLEADDEMDLKAHYGKTYKINIDDTEKTDDDGVPWQNVTMVKSVKKAK